MVWFLVLIVIVTVALLMVKWNNFYGLVFALAFFAVEILILVIIFSTSKFGSYQFQTRLEYHIYHEILKVKLNYYDLKRIANVGVCFFCTIMLLIAWKNSANRHKVRKVLLYGGMIAFVCFWILFLDSVKMHERIYVAVHTGQVQFERLETVIQQGELLLILACCVLPLWRIGYLIRNTRLQIQKKYLFAVWISTGILIAIFLVIVSNAPMKYFLWNYMSNNFRNLYKFYQHSGFVSKLIWLFPLIVGIILLLARFDILREKSFVKRKWFYRNSMIRINDLRHVFHSYKNAMFSIECMCDTILTEYGKPESKQAVSDVLSCARSYHEQISKFLNIYNRSNAKWDRFQMQDAVQEAKKRIGYAREAPLLVRVETEDDFIYGDYESVVEMFVNLINNAREAILKTERGEGEIRINIWTENMLVCVSVRDNGEGMDKKTLRNLYTPFFTTKKTFQNWGIGMSQIRKTVDSHQGFINVESKLGKYTEFQIAIPMDL